MAVSGLLAQYLALQSQISYVEMENTKWNDLATATSKKLSEQENQQSKWEDASGKVDDVWGDSSSSLIYKGVTYWNKGVHTMSQSMAASHYAHAKVPKFDSDKLEELSALDIEYSTMASSLDTLLTELDAQRDSLKERIAKEAGDTHMIQ